MNIVSKLMIVGSFKMLKSFVIVFLMLSAGTAAYTKPLIALTATNKNLTKLTDAAMADLSEKNILLVERTQVDKVIKEQKLSASGLVNANSLVRTGAILKADIIIVLAKFFNETRFIAFDVKTGIRLQDRFLNNGDFEAKLNWTVSAVLNAIKKYQSIKTKNVTLFSFLPINLILLRQNEVASAKMTEMLLKQDLLENENYLILERDQIDALLNERIISQSALKNLLPGSYIVELEVQAKGVAERILTANLILRKSRIQKIDWVKAVYHTEADKEPTAAEKFEAIKVVYQTGAEEKNASEISTKLNRLLKASKNDSASNRKAEALSYLKDSRLALKNFDPGKSILSAKNAYLLDPSLKIQINELLQKNYYYLSDQMNKCYDAKRGTEKYKKLLSISRLVLDFMAFYKTVNGQPVKHWILRSNRVLPLDMQHEIQQAYDEYFSEWLAIIKRKYDYKTKTPGTFEYLSTYKDYLKHLRMLARTCVQWTKYIEPQALKYLDEVEYFYKKHPHSKNLSSIVRSCAILPLYEFHSQNNELDASAFDKNMKILQRMLDSSIISWKIIALKDLRGMIYYYNSYRRFSINFDPNSKYAVALVRKIYKSPLIQRIGSPEKRYKIFSAFLDKAAETPNYIKNDIADYFNASIHGRLMQKAKNKQLDPVYVKAVKAKIPMKRLMHDFSYDQLIQLKKATENIDNPEFKKLLDRYIGNKTRKSKPECKTEEYLSSRQKKIVIKEIPCINSYGVKYNSFFFPAKAVKEKNYIYLPLCTDDHRFALVKMDLDKNGEATLGKIKTYTADLSISHWPKTCIGPKNLFLISPGSVIIYPKDGTLPRVIKVQAMINTKIQSACFLNGKIYACISKSYEKKLPTRIIELDPVSKTAKVVFSEKQTVNNPFKSLHNMKIEGEISADTKKNCLTMAVRNIMISSSSPYDRNTSSWSFFPGTGKWKNNGKMKIYADTPEIDFEKINNLFWIATAKYTMSLVDFSKQKNYINNFVEMLGLSAGEYKGLSTLQIRLEQAKKYLYLGNCVSCGTNLYRENGIIFLKSRKIVKFNKEKILLPFTANKNQCYLSCKYYSNTKLDLELWLNTVKKNIAKSNDFKIIASAPPERGLSPQKNKKTSKTDSKECKSTLHRSKYEDANFTNEYLAINVPPGLPEDFYYPAGVFVEKNIMLIPNYSRSFKYFYLIRIDLTHGLETTFSPLGELKTKVMNNGSMPLTCADDKNLFMVSSNGTIVSYPKNGAKPQIFVVEELKRKDLGEICFLDGKIYIFIRPGAYPPGKPCKIAELDPVKKTFKYIFLNNQAENNPFKNLKSFALTSNFFADKTNKCIIMFIRDSGFWRFFPANGKWQKIEIKNHTNYSKLNGRIINNTFFTLADNNSMEVLDFSKDKKDINSFSRETGLKPKRYADYSAIKFALKYGGKPVYIRTGILDNNNLLSDWSNVKMLKYRISISPRDRQIASFKWKGKQHFLFVKFNKPQKKKLNYGFTVYTINPGITRGANFKIIDLTR